MVYLCHKRFKKTGASGRPYNISRGTELKSIGSFIAQDNSAVCHISSEDAFMYFARNDDGHGMERGELTRAIAYSPRKPNKENGYRFTEEEAEMLRTEYGRYLRNKDVLLFNDAFFNAPIEDLREISKRLEVGRCMQS